MKIKQNFIIILIASLLPILQLNGQKSQPNLFLYIADDLGYNDIGYHGNPYVKTPTIDLFASKAVNFTQMHTASAMCSPSRSMIYTGLYPHRNGCHMNHGKTFSHVKSLPVYLKELGYSVALVEKIHIKPQEVYPFDYILNEELENYLDSIKPPVCVIFASHEPHGPHKNKTHNPDSVIIPAKWVDAPRTRNLISGYYSDVEEVEKEFQLFVQTIKNRECGKNSVIIFTSDHGYSHFAKWTCYQAGLKVPFYVQTNGINFSANKINQLTSFVDITPTFIELAGGKAPSDLDGKSLLPLLNGKAKEHHRYDMGHIPTVELFLVKLTPYEVLTMANGNTSEI
ncbi:MAG: sulfatase-like hydrolase/transferase [Bacteroidales bacterium]|nr:sulfatase-like hydrolase/transferase [Bacteroidales bacterium]